MYLPLDCCLEKKKKKGEKETPAPSQSTIEDSGRNPQW